MSECMQEADTRQTRNNTVLPHMQHQHYDDDEKLAQHSHHHSHSTEHSPLLAPLSPDLPSSHSNSRSLSPASSVSSVSSVASESDPSSLRASHWFFWDATSPSFRFFILSLAMMVPFGAHVVKSSLSSLADYFLNDQQFHLSHTQFGSFQSALSLPNLFIPFLGGLLLDLRDSRIGTISFLALTLIGHAGFTLACSDRNYLAALITRALFGLGQGSTVVAQGRIAATFFHGHEVVFAIAICESMHNVSAMIARIYVVPLARYTGSYIYSLWMGVLLCALSFLAGVVYYMCNPAVYKDDDIEAYTARYGSIDKHHHHHHHSPDHSHTHTHHDKHRDDTDNTTSSKSVQAAAEEEEEHKQLIYQTHAYHVDDGHTSHTSHQHHPRHHRSLRGLFHRSKIRITFLLLCILHLVHANSYHLFDYISANFIQMKYHTSVEDSAYLSAITAAFAIVLCPIAGIVLDRTGYKMYVVAGCSSVTCIAYLIMAYTDLTPIVGLVLLSLSISCIPTILRSSVPDCVSRELLGTAYGAYEVMESIGAVVGHTSVGLLVDVTNDYTWDILIFAMMSAMACIIAIVLSIIDSILGGTLNSESTHTKRKHRLHAYHHQTHNKNNDNTLNIQTVA